MCVRPSSFYKYYLALALTSRGHHCIRCTFQQTQWQVTCRVTQKVPVSVSSVPVPVPVLVPALPRHVHHIPHAQYLPRRTWPRIITGLWTSFCALLLRKAMSFTGRRWQLRPLPSRVPLPRPHRHTITTPAPRATKTVTTTRWTSCCDCR